MDGKVEEVVGERKDKRLVLYMTMTMIESTRYK